MACQKHDSRKLVFRIKPKGLLWHVYIVRPLPMPCFNWIALNMKETILTLKEIVEIRWSSIICGDVDGASEKQDTSGDASSETRLQSSSSFSRLTHQTNDPPTHGPTPLIEPMGCLWPCNQCSVDGHCFGLFCNQYTMFRWQSSVSNHWFVFGCFGLILLQPMFGGWTLYWIVLHFLDLCRDEALYAEHGVSRGTFLLGCSVLVCSGQIKMDFFFLLHSRLLWILPRTRIVFFYVCVTRLALQHFIRKQNFHKYNVTLNCKI